MTKKKRPVTPNPWIEPPTLMEVLGEFDTAPFSLPNRPWPIADNHYTLNDNPLEMDWSSFGRIWLFPPQGNDAKPYMQKLVEHGNGIALLPNRTETQIFTDFVWQGADAVLFIKSRLTFFHPSCEIAKGQAGTGSVLVAYGDSNVSTVRDCGIQGCFIDLRQSQHQIVQAA